MEIRLQALLKDLSHAVQIAFDPEPTSIYLMGSLSRGGFSEIASDIDLGIVFTDGMAVNTIRHKLADIQNEVTRTHPHIQNPISIFWSRLSDLHNESNFPGRFPPFDKLDLLENGKLIHGLEVRTSIKRPDHQELVRATVDFALGEILNESLLYYLADVSSLAREGTRSASKLCLFPARFVYLLDNNSVAGNAESVAHALEIAGESERELLAASLNWREHTPSELEMVELLDENLPKLYHWFLDRFTSSGYAFRRQELLSWKAAVGEHLHRT